jgi:hypothetical protein
MKHPMDNVTLPMRWGSAIFLKDVLNDCIADSTTDDETRGRCVEIRDEIDYLLQEQRTRDESSHFWGV